MKNFARVYCKTFSLVCNDSVYILKVLMRYSKTFLKWFFVLIRSDRVLQSFTEKQLFHAVCSTETRDGITNNNSSGRGVLPFYAWFLCVMIGNLLVFIANFALHQSYILLAPQKRIVIRSFLTSHARYAKALTTQLM